MKTKTRLRGALCLALCLTAGAGASLFAGGAQSKTPAPAPGAQPSQPAAVTVAPGASVSQSRDVVAAVTVDFTTMDPQDTSDTLSGGLQRLMLDGLFGFDDDLNVFPMLAEGYKANDDATVFTITLRKGIAFTDGTPWNADALIANLEKWDDKSLALKRTAFLSDNLDSWRKIDDATVEITLTAPFGAFINALAHPACVIMSPAQIKKGPAVCADYPVGTGQYKFVEWIRGDHLKIELNKSWWGYDAGLSGGKALVDKDAGFKSITFRFVSEGSSRAAMAQAGDAQIMWPPASETIATLQADKNLTVTLERGLVAYYIWLNTQKGPLTDKRVRQALNYAFNHEAYNAVVNNGIGFLPTALIGPDTQFAIEFDPWPYDLAKAKALLAEAGYPNGFKASLLAPQSSTNQKAAEFLRQQYAQAGVDLTVTLEESAIVNQKVQDFTGAGADAAYDVYLSGWSSSTGDADWAIRPLFATESFPPLNYNLAYYSNPQVDDLIHQGLLTADPDTRRRVYADAQKIIWDDCPVVGRYLSMNSIVTSNKIVNVKIFADGAINLRNARMAP